LARFIVTGRLSKLVWVVLLVVAILAVLSASKSCARLPSLPASPHGSVVNGSTGAPIEGAFVLARFIGDGSYSFIDPGAGVRNHCYGSLVSVTDSDGAFDFGRESPDRLFTKKYNRNLHVDVTAYAPGYSHENNKGYVNWLDRDLVIEKFEQAGFSKVTLSLTPQEESAYPSRHDYLVQLLGEFCGLESLKTKRHWSMLKAMLQDISAGAQQTSRDWVLAVQLCHLLNRVKNNGASDVAETNCAVVERELAQTSKREFTALQQLVRDIDWGDGPTLELLDYRIMSMNSGPSVFLVPKRPEGLSADEVAGLLKKVCDSDYPGNFVMGSACVYFGEEPRQKDASNPCHGYLRNNQLKINYGVAKGTAITLEKNWCRSKKLPPYEWPQSSAPD
jgi:hypothetical protein